ncbi:helix-turn-helix domain-containing protein [uncultured Mobiluncus sp.]|uniref:helix-turn-helix domain-containing protein n=1 Tax=uncultured Mobiluncus sp. TaxID=293425 RepID=UPI00345D62C5
MRIAVTAPPLEQTIDERIGELVRFWMYRRDTRQPQLASVLNLTQASVSRKISGKVPWTATELAKTAAMLDVPLSELMPEDTVEIAKSLEANASRDRGTVAGAGFEPTTSGL